MQITDLLGTAKETQDILKNNHWDLGIVYSVRFNCYIWCDMYGRAIEDHSDITGYKRVILSPKLLEKEGWYLTPKQEPSTIEIDIVLVRFEILDTVYYYTLKNRYGKSGVVTTELEMPPNASYTVIGINDLSNENKNRVNNAVISELLI